MRKRLFPITVLICYICLCQATILTVDPTPGSAAMYTQLNDALTAANTNDTIYLHASSIGHSRVSLTKKVHIIGEGHLIPPENVIAPYVQEIILYAGGDGSTISSIRTNAIYLESNNTTRVHNIAILNCMILGGNLGQSSTPPIQIGTYTGGNNWIIEGCVFYINNDDETSIIDASIHSQNLIVKNNIFYLSEGNSLNNILDNFRNSTTIINNVFLIAGEVPVIFEDCIGAKFENNIFLQENSPSNPFDVFNNCTGCAFNNNAFVNQDGSDITFNPANTQSDNWANPTIQFVEVDSLVFNYHFNYNLLANSFGTNAGTDGTDIGVFGQNFNFRNYGFSNFLPRISLFEPQFYTIPLETPLQINIEGKRAGL